MIIFVTIFIAILSVILSVLSLKKELKKTHHEQKVEENLAKSKVLFYSPSGSASDEA